jgi:hypothetical protein
MFAFMTLSLESRHRWNNRSARHASFPAGNRALFLSEGRIAMAEVSLVPVRMSSHHSPRMTKRYLPDRELGVVTQPAIPIRYTTIAPRAQLNAPTRAVIT